MIIFLTNQFFSMTVMEKHFLLKLKSIEIYDWKSCGNIYKYSKTVSKQNMQRHEDIVRNYMQCFLFYNYEFLQF